jgi:hypothetical protein
VRILLAIAALLLTACPQRGYGPWYFSNVTAYPVNRKAAKKTPGGVQYIAPTKDDTTAFRADLDAKVVALEKCLGYAVRRDWFLAYVPADWYVSKCSGEQLVPSLAPCKLCRDKGLVLPDKCCGVMKPTTACPCVCNFRAVLQGDYVVTAPNLKLFSAELLRLVTGEINVWTKPELVKCLK